MLFRQIDRTDSEPKRATETKFAFFDRCAWATADRVRGLLETCLSDYPQSEHAEMISRIQSGDERQFSSATFEVILYGYLLKLGYAVTPHPKLSNGSNKRPDFLVTCPNGEQLYVEAVCVSDNDGSDESAERRKSLTLNALDRASHPNFVVGVNSYGDPVSQPSGKKLAENVIAWLDTLDPDRVLNLPTDDPSAVPVYIWCHEDWHVEIEAIPLRPAKRGHPRRLIGVQSSPGGPVDGWSPIKDAIYKKTRRYGEPDLPLIIAVNVNTSDLHPIDELQALLGEERIESVINRPSGAYRFVRAPNGAWNSKIDSRSRWCSGAWLFNNLSASGLVQATHTLYENPWAKLPIPTEFRQVPYATFEDNRLVTTDGCSIQEAFGLNDSWPEED
ncbi:hypothetical protein ACMHYO_16180 [Allopusillimonas ginsengisoli]|uniref:hypothetical protein n=1 Tax=Allopusillimonas ginsengisoli TaxID=453575 RepID=UPI0039C16D0B